MHRVNLNITNSPINTWGLIEYPIIPRVGDRLCHPHHGDVLLIVDAVLIHRVEQEPKRPYPAADIYCSPACEGVPNQ